VVLKGRLYLNSHNSLLLPPLHARLMGNAACCFGGIVGGRAACTALACSQQHHAPCWLAIREIFANMTPDWVCVLPRVKRASSCCTCLVRQCRWQGMPHTRSSQHPQPRQPSYTCVASRRSTHNCAFCAHCTTIEHHLSAGKLNCTGLCKLSAHPRAYIWLRLSLHILDCHCIPWQGQQWLSLWVQFWCCTVRRFDTWLIQSIRMLPLVPQQRTISSLTMFDTWCWMQSRW
jgi:hypothetical protein